MVTSTNAASRFTKMWNWSTNCLKNTYIRVTLFITAFLSLILLVSAFDNPGKKKSPDFKVSASVNKSLFVGGDFSLDFVASAPLTYNHLTGGGAFDNRDVGRADDIVESLEGGDFTCGDLVSYLTEITVAAGAQGSQTIDLDYSFLAAATGQPGVALYLPVNVYLNEDNDSLTAGTGGIDLPIEFDGETIGDRSDGGDAAYISDGDETISVPVAFHLANATGNQTPELFKKPAVTNGTVRIGGLEAGETIIVRIDIKIHCQVGSSPTGNLQGAIMAGRVVVPAGLNKNQATLSVGQQTVPFKNVNLIHQSDCALDDKVFGCVDSIFTYEANTAAIDPSFAWTLAGNGQFVNSSGVATTPTTADSIVRVKATAPASNGTTGCFTLKVTITAPQFTPITCCDSVDVYAKPPAATVRLVEPSICGSSTGQVIVTCPKNPATGDPLYQYSNGGTTWQTDTVFSGIAAGANFSIYVRRITPDLAFACVSDVTNCTNYTTRTCTQPTVTSCTTPGCTETAAPITSTLRPNTSSPVITDARVNVYPNPYRGSVSFNFLSPVSGKATLEIYDMLGRRLATVYQGQLDAGMQKTVNYNVSSFGRVPLLYKLTVGDKSSTGKLLPGNRE